MSARRVRKRVIAWALLMSSSGLGSPLGAPGCRCELGPRGARARRTSPYLGSHSAPLDAADAPAFSCVAPRGLDANGSGRRRARSPHPLPILPCLCPRTANRHRAPATGLIATVVVERPSAVFPWAGLQAGPAAINLRNRNDRCDTCQGTLEVAVPRLKVRPLRRLELHEQPRGAKRTI